MAAALQGITVRDFRAIAANYLRTWFLLDFAGRSAARPLDDPPRSPAAAAQDTPGPMNCPP
jgi:hypothetical protein